MRLPLRALRLGRENAEALMVDTVKVERFIGRVRNPVTLVDVDKFETVYSGRGKIQAYDGQYEKSSEAGGGNYVASRSYLHVPISAGPFEQGDRVTFLSSPYDSSRGGQQFLLEAATGKSVATAQRLPVTRIEAIT
jgi:hypothetical protein